MRSIITAKSKRGPSVSNPGANKRTTKGDASIPNIVTHNNATPKVPDMASIKCLTSSLDLFF